MFITTISRYKSTCHNCGGLILPGDMIEFNKVSGVTHCQVCRGKRVRSQLLKIHENVCERYR